MDVMSCMSLVVVCFGPGFNPVYSRVSFGFETGFVPVSFRSHFGIFSDSFWSARNTQRKERGRKKIPI